MYWGVPSRGFSPHQTTYIKIRSLIISVPTHWTRTWEWRYSSVILNLDTIWGKWSVSLTCRFSYRETTPGTYCVGGFTAGRLVWELQIRLQKPRLCTNQSSICVIKYIYRVKHWRALSSRTVVPMLWYAYPWGYSRIILVMAENNKKRELK
jgi:hypothetical protein